MIAVGRVTGARVLAPQDLHDLRVLIIGAAREGTALARALATWGAIVTLADSKPPAELSNSLDGLPGLGVRLALGVRDPDLAGVEVLFLSPGVPPSAPVVGAAREQGIPISSEPRLFAQLCPAPIVGITGSSGKTTTTALVGAMCAAQGLATWVGGNIGLPLTGRLVEETRPDIVVMELSSFQLELYSPAYQGPRVDERRSARSRKVSVEGWSPPVAAITNITPNHLDRHPSMEDYVRAKRNILAFQGSADWAVLNLDNEITHRLVAEATGAVLTFSLEGPVAQGAYLREGALWTRFDGRERRLCAVSDVRLRGQHNLANILTAACCALAAGVEVAAIRDVATSFTGVPHRLETVRQWRGVTFVNDSIATSPERAIAALRSYDQPVVLLAGGRDKHLPWDAWAELALERTRVVIAFGEAVPIIVRALAEAREARGTRLSESPELRTAGTLEEAVALAAALAETGDVVLLSPGGTSFDAFTDFEARGQRFRDLVAAL